MEITQCLGYDWNKKAIHKTINMPINHRSHSQFFLNIILGSETNTCMSTTQHDINNQTG